jgi:beta-lactamase superfamily II metal-dependent hydrolase
VWWTVVALIACVAAWIAAHRTVRLLSWFVTISLIVGLWVGVFRPYAQSPGPGEVFVESIAVGNGACHLIRTNTITVLIDAGTSGDSSAGSRRMVPALAALGVRRIDRLIIGSRSLAEVSGVPEILLAFKISAIVMDTRCLAAFRSARDGFPTDVLHAIAERNIPIFSVVDKQSFDLGNMSMKAVVPPPNPAARHDNGGLMVEIRHQDWLPAVKSVVVCGDPKLAARAQLLTTPAASDCAIRTIADDRCRLHLQLWTVRGWK